MNHRISDSLRSGVFQAANFVSLHPLTRSKREPPMIYRKTVAILSSKAFVLLFGSRSLMGCHRYACGVGRSNSPPSCRSAPFVRAIFFFKRNP